MASNAFEQHTQVQHGLITTQQLLNCGYTRSGIKTMTKRGQIRCLYRGVHYLVGVPFTRKTRIMGAVLACPDGSVASHFAALYLSGLIKGDSLIRVDVTMPTGRGQYRNADFETHRSFLPKNHTVIVDGIRTTSLARALLDIAGVVDTMSLAKYVDEALATERVTTEQLATVLDDYGARGVRGAAAFRNIVDARRPLPKGSKSKLELRLLKLTKQAGLPPPKLQYRIQLGKRYYIDAYWPEQNVAVEMDGYGAHGTSRKRFDEDRERNNALLLAGIPVLHFTARMADRQILDVLKPFFATK